MRTPPTGGFPTSASTRGISPGGSFRWNPWSGPSSSSSSSSRRRGGENAGRRTVSSWKSRGTVGGDTTKSSSSSSVKTTRTRVGRGGTTRTRAGGIEGVFCGGGCSLPGTVESSMLVAAAIDFGIQFVGWAVASKLKTEKFYDVLGSAAFASTAAVTLASSAMLPRQKLVSALAMTWTARLGVFLGLRAHRDGGDSRFDGVKENPGVFAVYWFLQGVWVWVTSLPVYLLNGSPGQVPSLNAGDWTFAALWAFGFVFEVTADIQKYVFKSNLANKGKFIQSGLWSVSRHPNYFGEIVMWCAMAGLAVNGLGSSTPIRAIGACTSPLFVTYLLTKMSGIPILEKMGNDRWGKDEAYQKYKKTTPVLIPKLFGC